MTDDGEKPSRESMREVKAEFKARQKAEQARAQDARKYWDAQTGRAPKSSGGKGLAVGLVALVAVGGVAATAILHAGPFAASAPVASAGSGASAAPSSSPSHSGATPAGSQTGVGTDPKGVAAFENSPAKAWRTGAAGITAPAAHQVGIYRRPQVREAYAHTVRYLEVALLDPAVLFRGRLDPVLAVLGPQSTSWLKRQHALGVRTRNKQGIGWDQVANRFHVGDWKASPEIRVRGRIIATQDSQGQLVVSFVYVAAYWLVPAQGGAARTIAIRRSGRMYFLGQGASHVTDPNYGGSGYVSSSSVCGSAWPYPDFVEAWIDKGSVHVASPSPATSAYDPTDVNAPDATTCFTDTSGF